MIQSFADRTTKEIFNRIANRKIPEGLQRQALKRLNYLDLAKKLEDLYKPPANQFHALSGGRYSLWVNKQWRITFEWTQAGPTDVRLEDYH